MNFGICMPSAGHLSSPDSLTKMAQRAEELGYHAISFSDHIVIPEKIGAPYPYASDHKAGFSPEYLEQLTSLSFIAARTKRVKLLTSIMVIPHRNPLIAAKMLATLDVLSGGRVIAGVGTGWMEDEFLALGLPPFEERGAVTDEYLRVFRELWKDGVSSFGGKYSSFSRVVMAPKPVQRPGIPIWVGGESRRAMERATRLGDGWYPTPNNAERPMRTFEQLRGAVDEFYSKVDSASRSRREFSIGLGDIRPHLDGKIDDDDLFSGTPKKIREDVSKCESLGIDYLGMNLRGGSVDETLRIIERFANEVVFG